jgi:hypothetical protein
MTLLVSLQRPKVQPPSSQAARAATSLALSVVGKRVEVWWEDDQQYYSGRITHYNAGAQVHSTSVSPHVRYMCGCSTALWVRMPICHWPAVLWGCKSHVDMSATTTTALTTKTEAMQDA